MAKTSLVILESPGKAGTVKSYLGSRYKVVASVGHIRDLPKSTLGIDIEDHFTPKYINIRGKGDLIRDLKREAKAADRVYLATDPDREGEAISWHLAEALDLDPAKTKRVTFNEITKRAVQQGIKNPREIDMNLVNSQQARRILDRIVGYKLSPFLWKTVRSGLSAGRVQSVATRIIVDRENEIRAFVPEEYWTLDAALSDSDGRPVDARYLGIGEKKTDIRNKAEMDALLAQVEGKPFEVRTVRRGTRIKNPPAPFITSSLLQECASRLSFPSQRTMRVAQELYEGIDLGSEFGGTSGLITYMRTDSYRISEEAQESARAYIREAYGESYLPETARVFKASEDAQDAHEAIRPSHMEFVPEKIRKKLTPDQYKLYRLIWNRFLASQMAGSEQEIVQAELFCGEHHFRSSGYVIRFKGYLAAYEEEEEEGADSAEKRTVLPNLSEGQMLEVGSLAPEQHFTEPPPRYTEATLIKFFKEKGIGRPSTYTPILSTILDRGYVVRDGKSLKPTPLGETTNKLMVEYFSEIVDETFTAQMETELDDIANGGSTIESVLSGYYKRFEKDLEKADASVAPGTFREPVTETDILCDKCGAKMIIKTGRFGKFAACPNYPACRNTKPLKEDGTVNTEKTETRFETTDLTCELCGAPVVIRAGRFGRFYACENYPTCKFTKPVLQEIGIACPKCGKPLVQRRGRNRMLFFACSGYPECDFSSFDTPLGETCPRCGGMLFRKKGKPLIVCPKKGCGYQREIPKEEADAGNEGN